MKTQTWSRAAICARVIAIAAAAALLTPALAEAAIAVTITWNASSDPATVGYSLYAGTESRNYSTSLNVGNTTSAVMYLPDPRDPSVTYYFAVQAYSATGARSQLSAETIFTASQAPTLRNPGSTSGIVGLSVVVQLSATDPRGLPLTYSAGSLPPGVLISSNSGRISGTPTTAGNYDVTVAASNTNGVSATQLFTWSIVGPTSGGGTPGGGGIGTPPPSGGTPGGGGIGTPPPSGGNPGGGGGSIGSPPPPSGGNPGGGGGIGTPPPFGGGNPGGTTPGTDDPIAIGNDHTPPTVRITSPTIDRPYRTMNVKIIVTGVASDNVGVVSVMWANSRGGVGTSLGTSSWATTPIDLKMGDNILTITASDAAGNVQTVTFTVTRIVDFENYVN
jgi:hypothetical protein